ncbi:MAG: M48 family metalloprotease, partial [Alphaproteobacteria bacterium]
LAASVLLSAVAVASVAPADAEPRRRIRDAEIENTIRAYATPVFEAAGLNAADVNIIIVGDDALNAFVAGGMNLFIHTGLLTTSGDAGQLIGVIAHETGHIAGGHLARFSNRIRNASRTALIAMILGTAASALNPDAGKAIILGGTGLAQQTLLRFSRVEESAADQAALSFLDRTGQSARGMMEFLTVLKDEELLVVDRQSPYVRTHPLTRDRIEQVRNHVAGSRFSDVPVRHEFAGMHRRMRAKLFGFLSPPGRTLKRYKSGNGSLEARYARAIAYYRIPDLAKALPLIDGLIAERPEDPYFHELKGQILFENGRGAEALGPYARAVDLLPDAALLRVALARVQLEHNDPALVKDAVAHLKEATRLDAEDAFAWSQLAVAYGRDGHLGMSALAQAEAAMARGNKKEAGRQARRAAKLLGRGSSAWLRAEDIKQAAKKKN